MGKDEIISKRKFDDFKSQAISRGGYTFNQPTNDVCFMSTYTSTFDIHFNPESIESIEYIDNEAQLFNCVLKFKSGIIFDLMIGGATIVLTHVKK